MPPNTPQLLFEKKAHGDVRQDKIAKSRDHIASGQPAAPQRGPRPQLKSNFGNHEKLPPAPGDRTVPLTLHVRPIVKDRIREIADLEGLKSPDSPPSLSVIGSRYLERGLQEHMDMQYGALLEPMLKKILDKNQQQLITLFRWLLVRIAFDGNQTRTLVTNIFVRAEHIPKDAKDNILAQSAKAAKANIFSKSPHIRELLRELDLHVTDERGRTRN